SMTLSYADRALSFFPTRRSSDLGSAALMISFSTSNINHDTFKSVGPPLPKWRRKPQEDRTMKSIIRKDEAAVSPVIATILMVAITLVLAAVLYVQVSGLITGPGGTPQAMGGGVQPSSDGSNWIVSGIATPRAQVYWSSTMPT